MKYFRSESEPQTPSRGGINKYRSYHIFKFVYETDYYMPALNTGYQWMLIYFAHFWNTTLVFCQYLFQEKNIFVAWKTVINNAFYYTASLKIIAYFLSNRSKGPVSNDIIKIIWVSYIGHIILLIFDILRSRNHLSAASMPENLHMRHLWNFVNDFIL